MTYSAVLTVAGEALYAAALMSGTPIVLSTMSVGDGGGSPIASPDPTRTTLVNQVYSTTINGLSVDPLNPNLMWAQLSVPPTVGGFTVREVGVFTSGGVLFAIANYPDTIKAVAASGTTLDLVINLGMIISNTALVTVTIYPSLVGATRAWVISTITPGYILPGGAQYQMLQKNSSAAGDFSWADPQSPWLATAATTGGVVNVSALTANNKIIEVTGALTANVTLTFPAAPGRWVVVNATTGPWTVTAIALGGTGVPVAQGAADTVFCDGSNVRYALADAVTQPPMTGTTALATCAYADAATPFRYVVPILSGYGTTPAFKSQVGDTSVSQFIKAYAMAVSWSMPVLSTLNPAKPLKMRLHFTGDVGAGNFYLQLGYQIFANGPLGTVAYTNAVESVAAPATAGNLSNYLAAVMEIPASTLASQDLVNFVLTRLAANGADTNTGDFQLVNITMEQ